MDKRIAEHVRGLTDTALVTLIEQAAGNLEERGELVTAALLSELLIRYEGVKAILARLVDGNQSGT